MFIDRRGGDIDSSGSMFLAASGDIDLRQEAMFV
jgi:hypothetical protein